MHEKLSIRVRGQGLHEVTEEVSRVVDRSDVSDGICYVFIQHTSASLLIQENADPSAKRDLENWLNRLVPENDRHFTHTLEGPDDMPSHIKAALTQTTLTIPIIGGQLALGTWQGVFVWEHRIGPRIRSLVVSVLAQASKKNS